MFDCIYKPKSVEGILEESITTEALKDLYLSRGHNIKELSVASFEVYIDSYRSAVIAHSKSKKYRKSKRLFLDEVVDQLNVAKMYRNKIFKCIAF